MNRSPQRLDGSRVEALGRKVQPGFRSLKPGVAERILASWTVWLGRHLVWVTDLRLGSKLKADAFFKQNFAMLGFVFGAGFAFEMGFNSLTNKYWDHLNRGRQWKDIRGRYAEAAEDDEE
ncbi:predicted protein [Verticillium alfalfae VaMs.102]|uniref:Complex III subunit 9 n=1 Tax=Verticillium alfalfae (strain VaMs.102 / ATCC MYA-4576 / FGSC 10136) TaxID=526221 RepID=C9SM63_VERA1|nr:predicted protein [Verticillium alfalfae VaMs.102]EEY19878.1 predicted protein [Verticillium alfalfae VaMs.102]